MTLFREGGLPLIALTPVFLNQFALNLESPERGPWVPSPRFGAASSEDAFERRPFRADPQGVFSMVEAIARRYRTQPGSERLKDPGGGEWDVSNIRHEEGPRRFSMVARKDRKFLFAQAYREVSRLDVGVHQIYGAGVRHLSYWSPDPARNWDEIIFSFLSKKGPPRWKDLDLGALTPLLSLIFFQAADEEGVEARSSVHRSWERRTPLSGGRAAVEDLLDQALRDGEPFTARTCRRARFRDEFEIPREEAPVQMRAFRPWRRAPWHLEMKFMRFDLREAFPPAFIGLARQAGELLKG